MKKSTTVLSCIILLGALFSFSCSTLNIVFGEPKISLKSIGIQSLDREGITFYVDYSVSNPYPVGFSVQRVAANITYEQSVFARLTADEGVNVRAGKTSTNTVTFKLPYDMILNLANRTNGKTSLPFTINGTAYLDLGAIPYFEGQSLELPFTKDFDVPIFKPQFSISNVQVQLPAVAEITKAFTNSGMNVARAGRLAAQLISGQGITADIFDGVHLDVGFSFTINVAHTGGAPWRYQLKSCALQTSAGTLVDLTPHSAAAMTTGGGIPINVSLNTLNAAAFIVQLLTKRGTNPVFTFDSELTFTELPYAPRVPLFYSYEIPLSQVNVSNR
ncbi:MAG: LEA type 2 family protein [Treponema sp.]|nr:LEA type 2 family protein [Treponema sp.]